MAEWQEQIRRLVGGRKTYVALDIGTHVEVALDRDQLVVSRLGSAPIAGWASAGGDGHEISLTIRDLFDSQSIASREVFTNLSGAFVVSRSLSVPSLARGAIDQILSTDALAYLPPGVGGKDVVVDYQVIGETQARGKGKGVAQVLIVAARKDAIHEHVDLLRQAGLLARRIDANCLSLLEAFQGHRWLTEGRATAILDVGASSTKVVVVERGAVRLSSELTFGGVQVTQALASRYDLDEEGAEALKLEVSRAGEETESVEVDGRAYSVAELRETLESLYEALIGSLRRLFDFYQRTEFAGSSVDSLILAGGGARAFGLQPFLAAKMLLDVEVGNPFGRLPFRLSGPALVDLDEASPRYALALGLALKGMAPREGAVDLLPLSVRDDQTRVRQGRRARRVALVYFGVLALVAALLAEGRHYFRAQADYAREQTAVLRPLVEEATRLEEENVRLRDKLALLEGLGGGRLIWAKALHDIGSLVPDGVWLTDISSEERLRVRRREAEEASSAEPGRTVTSLTMLTVEGRGSSESDVSRFLRALETSPAMTNVRLDYVREIEDEGRYAAQGVEFQIRLAFTP
ncbi:hypothetical protein AMJ71_07845 [candidate division TA06 bacterium SM1_40]|uniref:SHS2 domain-containing protein n=1 Tax=candidate division TA06 bacterium SM1_40 TaxID=1703773 RepID=A0A0S8JFX5_UNCT6|nr:MAG: hypothetical protein AMJ71_07845 [candidate division TA06 bacterium SM1_40]